MISAEANWALNGRRWYGVLRRKMHSFRVTFIQNRFSKLGFHDKSGARKSFYQQVFAFLFTERPQVRHDELSSRHWFISLKNPIGLGVSSICLEHETYTVVFDKVKTFFWFMVGNSCSDRLGTTVDSHRYRTFCWRKSYFVLHVSNGYTIISYFAAELLTILLFRCFFQVNRPQFYGVQLYIIF